MHVACFSGSYDCVKFLIRCGADVGILDIFNKKKILWRNFFFNS